MRLFNVYVIGPCKRCGSNHTGRIIKRNISDKEIANLQFEALKKGEYIRIYRPGDADQNCFCADCGLTWYEDIHYTKMSYKEKKAYIRAKKDNAPISELREILQMEERQPKPEKEHPVLKQAGKLGIKLVKGFAHNMLYEPTVGTIKDIFGTRQKSDDSVQQEEQLRDITPLSEDKIYEEEKESETDYFH